MDKLTTMLPHLFKSLIPGTRIDPNRKKTKQFKIMPAFHKGGLPNARNKLYLKMRVILLLLKNRLSIYRIHLPWIKKKDLLDEKIFIFRFRKYKPLP